MQTSHPYDDLTPETILEAVETTGVRCTGALLALNSYENRVYRVDTEADGFQVAKFYRPARWSDEAILEEHAFAHELAEHEIPVVPPLAHAGRTLHEYRGFRFALFAWRPARMAELNTADDFRVLGRYVGRLHAVGRATRFRHRITLAAANYGEAAVQRLAGCALLPDELRDSFAAITRLVLDRLRDAYPSDAAPTIRLHGDLHLGNVLWGAQGPILVDLDDCLMGPRMQDLWMLLSGERAERERQLEDILSGYTQFASFDSAELALVEPLRTLRLLHYNAWIAARWDDPAFPRSFPWFATGRHWQDLILTLREQLAALDEPPLAWSG